MSEDDGVKMVSVELFGQPYEVPADKATALIASRDENKSIIASFQQNEETAKAARLKAETEATNAQEKVIEEKAMADGNIEQLTTLNNTKLAKKDARIKRLLIGQAVARIEGLAPTAVSDATNILSGDPNIDMADDGLVTGQGSIDAYLQKWADERPHLLVSKLPPGSGGTNGSTPDADIPTITEAEYEKDRLRYSDAIGKRELIIKD